MAVQAQGNPKTYHKQELTIVLAAPRGFCAGVERAINIVEKALVKFGAPVYVRHEIVHNQFVVQQLEAKGAIFVKELDEIPEHAQVVFSAHGVPKSVPANADTRKLHYFDATCPLVSKIHREVERHHAAGRTIILIGHKGHAEVIGTMGQVPLGSVILIENLEDVANLDLSPTVELAYATQTTLSVDDVSEVVKALKEKFINIQGPQKGDICYATTNRQLAVQKLAENVDGLIVIGAPNSSNSLRLVEVAKNNGCKEARLYQRAQEIDWDWLHGKKRLGLSAGASAPEVLVEEVIAACRSYFDVSIEEIIVKEENVYFNVPRTLRD